MKTLAKTILVLTSLIVASAGAAQAQERNPHYSYGQRGYWDEGHHHRYHHWETYHGHQGYWYHRDDGVRVFIDI